MGSTIGAKGRFNPDMMKRGCFILSVAVAFALILPSQGETRCAEGSVQRDGTIGPLPAAFTRYAVAVSKGKERRVAIDWFGHSFFRITSPKGTRILTDPFSDALGLPIPRVQPDIITVSREHEHHNSAYIAGGNPIVLRGLTEGGAEWAEVHRTVGDVLIYNVPVSQRTYDLGTKGSAFVFEMGGLCIAHLGDVAEALTPSQLRRLGKIHLAMIPIGGTFTVGPEEAAGLVDSIKPHIVLPMHYWDDGGRLKRFEQTLQSPVRRVGRGPFILSRRNLPPPTQIVIMEHE